jgi:hypothetical protein
MINQNRLKGSFKKTTVAVLAFMLSFSNGLGIFVPISEKTNVSEKTEKKTSVSEKTKKPRKEHAFLKGAMLAGGSFLAGLFFREIDYFDFLGKSAKIEPNVNKPNVVEPDVAESKMFKFQEEGKLYPESPGECVMFNSSAVKSITHSDARNYLKELKSNFESLPDPKKDFSGWFPDEQDIRKNPFSYFGQVTEEGKNKGLIFVKVHGKCFPCGYFQLGTLSDVQKETREIPKSDKIGKAVIIYSSGKNEKPVDINEALGDEADLFGVDSNQNGIETKDKNDFNKMLWGYYTNITQGSKIMSKCPFASLVLLHLFNGRSLQIQERKYKDLFQVIKDQIQLNLTGKFRIENNAGYPSSETGISFTWSSENKYVVFNVKSVFNAAKFGVGEKIDADEATVSNVIIAGSLPKSYEGLEFKEDHVKLHLRQYYLSVIHLAKLNQMHTVVLPILGNERFNIPVQWHIQVLKDLKTQITDSGVTIIINGGTIDILGNVLESSDRENYCIDVQDCEDLKAVVEKLNAEE